MMRSPLADRNHSGARNLEGQPLCIILVSSMIQEDNRSDQMLRVQLVYLIQLGQEPDNNDPLDGMMSTLPTKGT